MCSDSMSRGKSPDGIMFQGVLTFDDTVTYSFGHYVIRYVILVLCRS